jgi:HNH endonuclease
MPHRNEDQEGSNRERERLAKEQEEALLARLLARRELDPITGCWHFRGSITGNGYGHVSYSRGTEYTHRLAAMLFLDLDLKDGRVVRHVCDVPACFNPDHLRLGTQADNMRDAAETGRMTGKKLLERQVAVIKYQLALGRTHRSLALEYGVSTTAIGQIARGETWKAVKPRPAEPSDDSAETFKAGEEG